MKLRELYYRNRTEFFRLVRYLLVGGWNTVFGIGSYALLFELLGERVHYLLLLVPANILAVTNAFFCYKYLVFKTHGNGWKEYFRCYLIYGAAMLLGAAGLWFLVDCGGLNPIAANIVVTVTTVICSYLGHRFFSFGTKSGA